MGWFKRRRRGKAPGRPPRRELAPVEEIVEQGLLVADVAARMSVKNAIIMNALKRKVDYDKVQVRDMVRETLIELAEERVRDARHIERMRSEIRSTGRSAWSDSEYGNDDNRTLRHRQEVYEGVAAELRGRAEDADHVNRTAERAWEAAWAEVGDSLKERASHPYYAGGGSPEYRRDRDARIRLLIERDLTALVQQRAAEESGASRKARNAEQKAGARRPGRAKPRLRLRRAKSDEG